VFRWQPEVLCELVDGTLVEKPMGFREGILAVILSHLLCDYLEVADQEETARQGRQGID
jgi:hypothetical protein